MGWGGIRQILIITDKVGKEGLKLAGVAGASGAALGQQKASPAGPLGK